MTHHALSLDNAIHLIMRARVKVLLRGHSRASNAKTSEKGGDLLCQCYFLPVSLGFDTDILFHSTLKRVQKGGDCCVKATFYPPVSGLTLISLFIFH